MIRPKTGCVLLRMDPPETTSKGGIALANHRITPEEQQQANHNPSPPPPQTGEVIAIGPWKKLGNGMAVLPPFAPNSKVLIREGSGAKLTYGVDQRLRLVNIDDVLAVLYETC